MLFTMKTLIKVALLLLVCHTTLSMANLASFERKLNNYNSFNAMIAPQSIQPVKVDVSMHINSLCWRNNKITVNAFFRQKWTDDRLGDSGSSSESYTFNHKILDKIWIPDTFFSNAEVSELNKGGATIDTKTGAVHYSKQIKVKAVCPITFHIIERNKGRLNCTLEIESYMHKSDAMQLKWTGVGVDSYNGQSCSSFYEVYTKKTLMTLSTGVFERLTLVLDVGTGITADVYKYLAKQKLMGGH